MHLWTTMVPVKLQSSSKLERNVLTVVYSRFQSSRGWENVHKDRYNTRQQYSETGKIVKIPYFEISRFASTKRYTRRKALRNIELRPGHWTPRHKSTSTCCNVKLFREIRTFLKILKSTELLQNSVCNECWQCEKKSFSYKLWPILAVKTLGKHGRFHMKC